METQLYQVNHLFAKEKNIPAFFAANSLVRTQKATYVYGQGTLETTKLGVCCICGRTLTHPVSIELGIGPECGQHYWDWDLVGGYSMENQKRLISEMKIKIAGIKVDCWIPNTCIKQILPSTEVITTPADHPMLKPREIAKKRASYQEDNKIKIEFPFDMDLLGKVKTLPDRRFNAEGKYWICPLTSDNISKLQEWGFQLDDFLQKFYDRSSVKVTVNDVSEIQIPGLKGKLFPFQSKGVSFIEAKDGRALIADSMGLGKTVQALAWLQLHPEKRPAIVVVPASLKLNWQKEAETWMPEPNVEILSGTKPWKTTGDILIINYDVLPTWVESFQTIKPQVLIMDECHYIKNNAAKRTKAIKTLAKKIPHVIGLSGTPIMNRPVEIDNAVRLINPTILPSFWSCAHKFYGAKNNGYGWDFSGATNTQEFHKLLTESIMIRRKKMDVLTDLPDKIYSFLPIELDNPAEYNAAENDFLQFIKDTKGQIAVIKASNAETLTKIETLKQLAVQGKLKQAIEWIKEFLESDQKLVIFAVHKFVIDSLMLAFPDISVKIDGSVENSKRQDAVDQFQNNPKIRLFIGNIQAAGVGITLTASSNVAFLELPWTPGALVQAADRCHRIGQKNNVVIHYLLAVGTIEEKIALMLDHKLKVLDKVLDGKETTQESLLSELINEYK
jgi:SWI/SNF-related matrix-associated actin-dependent regulator 1 of chromatin subfamily A